MAGLELYTDFGKRGLMKKALCVALAAAGLIQPPLSGAASSSLQDRMAKEELWKSDGLFILPYRPNYFLPLSYNPHPNNDVLPAGSAPLEDIETKFQISVKVPLADHVLDQDIATYAAYTQVSYWQTYNKAESSLLRDTDYEPEFFLQFNSPRKLGIFTNRYNRIGYDHQSNGQQGLQSRSWNRIYAEFVLDYGNTMLSVKPWYRLTGPPEHDSNPDMWKYLGYGELRGTMKFWKSQEVSVLLRNNLRIPDNKGAVELGWTFPIIRSMKGYVQYFNGYGESLIDYNTPVSRLSAGFSFSNWL